MKISPECPAIPAPSEHYFCHMLKAERSGRDEEICSICPRILCESAQNCNLEKALAFAAEAHQGQMRKGTDIPYLIHLIRTWDYVRRMTEDEDELVAALLHDVLEDTAVSAGEIRNAFGDRVEELVKGESECKREEYPAGLTWKIRKEETVERLRGALGRESQRAAMHIALGDKLANLYSMVYEYRQTGEHLWKKFNQKEKSMHAWYYGEMGRIFADYFRRQPEYRLVEEYQKYYKEVFGEYEVSGS